MVSIIKEPKAMEEIHKIREKMSRMSDVELYKELDIVRKKYKNIIAG